MENNGTQVQVNHDVCDETHEILGTYYTGRTERTAQSGKRQTDRHAGVGWRSIIPPYPLLLITYPFSVHSIWHYISSLLMAQRKEQKRVQTHLTLASAILQSRELIPQHFLSYPPELIETRTEEKGKERKGSINHPDFFLGTQHPSPAELTARSASPDNPHAAAAVPPSPCCVCCPDCCGDCCGCCCSTSPKSCASWSQMPAIVMSCAERPLGWWVVQRMKVVLKTCQGLIV